MSSTPNNKNKKEALGKGIRSLLQSIDADLKTTAGDHLKGGVVEKVTTTIRVAVEQIEVNPKQPRHDFDEQALNELANSIKLHDIIQPLTVSKTGDKYRIIAGERRWRAAKIAGLKDIPVYIRQANDQQLLELALLENLQRENLNAIEIGISYKRMMEELAYTQEQVAERMGKERSTVTNYIRLLKLPPDIQIAVRNNSISMGHARAIVNVDNVDQQLFIFNEIKKQGLSVRQTEDLVRKLYKSGAVKKPVKAALPAPFRKIEDNLASHYGTRVKMQHNKKGHGAITIEYFSIQELNTILEKMNVPAV
ncbi:ParB/RepB/Spo0J family partition protein [Agriterribacter sp.]|uniref:ParB/RepB/Spo0J family partition protein n=1 Tax=Agriterribacter sp. TaxID=2821509 RepID=UPI002B675632|nr:ParB/RepB/Spo0J family partition protein [Agriterribacter sp.]HTN07689.1 ParB/RepB/Spo0J family partition protein [Agriterribacter sp.]